MMRTLLPVVGIVTVGILLPVLWQSGLSGRDDAGAEQITVCAAASLADALVPLAKGFEQASGVRVRLDPASSGALRMKMQAGAPVDAFISASSRDMDLLESAGHIAPGTRRNILGNELVCVVPMSSALHLAGPADLGSESVRRIAIGDPDHVPAGHYARQALQHAGLWAGLSGRAACCADVRAALAHAEAGTVDAAIVYRSDARITPTVKVAFAFPPDTHDPIVYPCGVLRQAPRPRAAAAFLQALATPAAEKVFVSYGFQSTSKEAE
ncbi:MAG: molybdate ABC transporter substrate-binding protein [Planctomycetota bacterium]|jgi:molybdate transport system substrate-binding protein